MDKFSRRLIFADQEFRFFTQIKLRVLTDFRIFARIYFREKALLYWNFDEIGQRSNIILRILASYDFRTDLFSGIEVSKTFAWTKFRENGQKSRKPRKLIRAKNYPLKVFWFDICKCKLKTKKSNQIWHIKRANHML